MNDILPFTGERFTPECVREIWYEHWHRYAFARRFVAGKSVLDVACGEGYGSNLLADVAANVVGVDVSDQAVAHARARYGSRANLQFEQGDATALYVPAASFDVVTSFETLEHVDAHEALIGGLARALKDDGLLLISSPDKRTYSDLSGQRNEFHVRELYRDELEQLLSRHFRHVQLYGQKLLFQSAMWLIDDATAQSIDTVTASSSSGEPQPGLLYDPIYYIAVCSKQPLPAGLLPALSLFGDREESVYSHYNHEIRKNMAAGARIAELEAEIARLREVPD